VGDRVFPCSISIDGAPVGADRTYRAAGNSFLLGGGDNFTTFSSGTQPVTGPVDVDTAAGGPRRCGDHAALLSRRGLPSPS
jgi:5'-nucleotidase